MHSKIRNQTVSVHRVKLSGHAPKDISREVKGDETQVTALSGSCEVIDILPVGKERMRRRH